MFPEPNDFTQANPFFNPAKAASEDQWRKFLGWQLAWNNALSVSMMGCQNGHPFMVPWGNGPHALELIANANLNIQSWDELYTRHLDVEEYF